MADDVEEILTAAENLEISIDELDDEEFDIPPVDNPPTLESILNEPEDDGGFAEDELSQDLLLQGDAGETASISSVESQATPKKSRQKKGIRYAHHGAILRHVVLKGISAQTMSAADRVDAGMLTALAVSSLISVGTSHGLVLVFDPQQVLKWCLGSTAVGTQYGAVSALSFNRDCSRLLCGFARGQITMWDLTNGKLLRTITDAHPPGTAILHVKFTDDLTIAICSDSGGSVFELEFKRLIGVRTCESRCLFSGSRGEVCVIEPLHVNHKIQDHPMKDVVILAMASLSKVLIVTVRPHLRVMFMHPLKGDASTLPLLAWQFVIIQVSERDRVIDPVLAFARDQTIHFFQLICQAPDDIRVAALQKTELPYKLLAMTWLNSRTMAVIDTCERCHVLDVRTEEELEVLDLAEIQMVYSTSFYKSLATGGNVSKALAFAGERACYQSLVSYSGQLVLLGVKGVHVMTMRSWKERLDVLVRQDRYKEALELGESFFFGKAKGVVGLTGSVNRRRQAVSAKMLRILDEYVSQSVKRHIPPSGKIHELEEYYQTVIPVCVDYCLTLERTDILFNNIYDEFSDDPIAKGTFLECLEPYILSDKMVSITPGVMKDFVDHYQEKGMVQNVEACIVHMDIASLDIHQVVVLCWSHGLFDAILYIYNRGMQDYITPLEELLCSLSGAVNTGKQLTDDQIKLGNKLLVYISCCLAGRAYPLGEIPPEIGPRVKEEVFQCVTCIHTKKHSDAEPVYPHLKTLLHFDTREFFNVLALAFQEPEFNSEDGIQKRQRVVDILLRIMVESIGFTPMQISILFTFLARQMARHDNTIFVNRVLFEQVLASLCAPGELSRHEERQQALIELVTAGGLQHFHEDRLISLAEKAKFYRVCEHLYEKRCEFDKIFLCYLRDPHRQSQAFRFVHQVITGSGFTQEEKENVQIEVFNHLKELVCIDSRRTAQLMLVGFAAGLQQVLSTLGDDKQLLFDFLGGVFEYRESSNSSLYGEGNVTIESHVQELYIELMCEKQPENVYTYVRSSEGYRLEETLEICRRHQSWKATAYLLERAGDIRGAFNIILENLQTKVRDLTAILKDSNANKPEHDLSTGWSSVEAALHVVTQLCQRNSDKMDEEEREALWFPLLEAVMLPQRKLKEQLDPDSLQAFKGLTKHVLNSMMGYIALPAILQQVMQDSAYSSGRFGEIRELVLGMLDTYNYEKTLLNTCNRLVNHDLHQHLSSLTVTASRGIVPRTQACSLCAKNYSAVSDSQVICFRCGHGYHLACLRSTGSRHLLDGVETWLCYLCNSAKRGNRLSSTSRILRSLSSNSGATIAPSTPTRNSPEKSLLLTSEQMQAVDNLRRAQKAPSRLAVLLELSRQERSGSARITPFSSTILSRDEFQLRTAAPPVIKN